MELKKLFTEDRAVSPVIAVVLMIAVTVILAAVVAAFALGLGGGTDATPQASFDFDYDATSGNVTATMESGDVIEAPDEVWLNDTAGTTQQIASPVNTGTSATITSASGETARVIWKSGSSDKSSTLAKYEVP